MWRKGLGRDRLRGLKRIWKCGDNCEWPLTSTVLTERWRVTEASDIILVLLDSRCPPLHAPPSLRSYIQNLKPRKEVILVLTKSDLVDPEALVGWRKSVAGWWGGDIQVVAVMSYSLELLHSGMSERGRN